MVQHFNKQSAADEFHIMLCSLLLRSFCKVGSRDNDNPINSITISQAAILTHFFHTYGISVSFDLNKPPVRKTKMLKRKFNVNSAIAGITGNTCPVTHLFEQVRYKVLKIVRSCIQKMVESPFGHISPRQPSMKDRIPGKNK